MNIIVSTASLILARSRADYINEETITIRTLYAFGLFLVFYRGLLFIKV